MVQGLLGFAGNSLKFACVLFLRGTMPDDLEYERPLEKPGAWLSATATSSKVSTYNLTRINCRGLMLVRLINNWIVLCGRFDVTPEDVIEYSRTNRETGGAPISVATEPHRIKRFNLL